MASDDSEVTITHRVHRVAGDAAHVQILGHALAVDGEGGRGQRSRAERRLVGAAGGVDEAAAVAPEHGHVGEQVVGQADRLGALQVGVPGSE